VDKDYDFCAMVPLQVAGSRSKLPRIKQLIVGGAAISRGLAQKLRGDRPPFGKPMA